MAAFPEATQAAATPKKRRKAFPEADQPAAIAEVAGPAESSFLGSLTQIPQALGQALLAASPSPEDAAGPLGRHFLDIVGARSGDQEAADRLGAQGMLASLVGALVPVGPAIQGGARLLPTLASRAALGAAGGAIGSGTEALVSDQPVVPALGRGAATGAVLGPAFGVAEAGIKSIVEKRLAKRLSEMELEQTSRAALPGRVKEIADLVRTHQEIPAGTLLTEPGSLSLPKPGQRITPRRLIGESPEPGTVLPETRGGAIESSARSTRLGLPGVETLPVPPQPTRGFTPPQQVTAMDGVERFVRRGVPVPGEVADAARKEIGSALGGEDTPIGRVLAALKRAPRLIKRQEQVYTAERGARIARARGVRAPGTGGVAGYHRQLAQMSGPMGRVDFESLVNQIDPADIDALANQIDVSPFLDDFEKLTAQHGFLKLFGEMGGQVPAKDELRKLRVVFGDQVIGEILSKRPLIDKLTDIGVNTLGAWRSFRTAYDLSAPFTQGLYLGAGNPKEFVKSFVSMFKYAGSEKAFKELESNIMHRPTFLLMKRSGLGLTDMGHLLTDREEAFMSDWAEKIPGVRQSNRAYVGFLNKLRADVFDKLVREARFNGLDPGKDLAKTKEIADFINDASGRGRLGKIGTIDLARHADLLNAGFFSPRLMASRIRLMNPGLYIHSNPIVRKQALRSLLGMTAAGMTIIGLAKKAGADVDLNPKSVDFASIKVGNTRYNVFGGFSQYARLAANLMPFAGGPDSGSRLDYLARFGQGKGSPAAAFALDLLRGTDFKGDPILTPQWAADQFVPMMLQDLWDGQQEWGPEGVLMAAPALFGVRVQTYQ